MPYFKQIWLGAGTALQLWEIKETIAELLPWVELNEIEKEQLKKLKNEKRQIEFVIVRIMLRKVLPDSTILYNSAGAPYIDDNSNYISVSHSNRFVCLMHSCFPCGVDVEYIDSKALRVARRFLCEEELGLIHEDFPARDATLLWSAKESLFKLLKKENVDFARQLKITEVQDNVRRRIEAAIISDVAETSHILSYDFIDEQVITWITDENNTCHSHE